MFLCIGLFFIFPACDTFLKLQEEKLVPWELVGNTTNEDISLDKLLSIEGVERVSPVIQFDTEIQFGEYKLNCQVQAVHSSFLEVDLSEGTIYLDDSNMPFILLNKAAAESFLDDDNSKVTVSANTSVIMELNNEAANALICGVFVDEKDTPAVYMSYSFAKKILSQEPATKLLFALLNKGYSEQVALSLQREGITASYEENDITRWSLMEQQIFQFVLSSIGFLLCSAILIKIQVNAERKTEIQALLISGMTQIDCRQILSWRFIMVIALCIMGSTVFCILLGLYSFVGIISSGIVAFVYFWCMKLTVM